MLSRRQVQRRLLAGGLVLAILAAGLALILARRFAPPGWPLTRARSGQGELVLSGHLQADQQLAIKAPASGRVIALGATEGKPVAAGQLVLQIRNAEVGGKLAGAEQAARRAEAEAERPMTAAEKRRLARAEAAAGAATRAREGAATALRRYREGHGDAEEANRRLSAAETAARTAQVAARRARESHERLLKQSPTPRTEAEARQYALRQKEREDAEAAHTAGQAALTEARRLAAPHLAQIKQIGRLEERLEQLKRAEAKAARAQDDLTTAAAARRLEERQAAVAEAHRRLATVEGAASALAVKAPQAGVLTELRITLGGQATKGQTLAVIQLAHGAQVVCRVEESDLPRLRGGLEATVTPQQGAEFRARVSRIERGAPAARLFLQPVGREELPPANTAVTVRLRVPRLATDRQGGGLAKGRKQTMRYLTVVGIIVSLAILAGCQPGAPPAATGTKSAPVAKAPQAGKAVAGANGIEWLTALPRAKERAVQSGKNILIDFGATWCGACQQLATETFTDAEVVKSAGQFVCVKIDVDEVPDLAREYKVDALPTVLFVRADGTELKRNVGFVPAATMLELMRAAAK